VQTIFAIMAKSLTALGLLRGIIVTTWILILCHALSLAQDSGSPEPEKIYSPMTTKDRWSQYLNDNFVNQGA